MLVLGKMQEMEVKCQGTLLYIADKFTASFITIALVIRRNVP